MELAEKLLSVRNMTCRECKQVVPEKTFCRKFLQTGGFSVYHYCSKCNRSVGADPLPHRFALLYVSELESLPTVENYSATKALKPNKAVKKKPVKTSEDMINALRVMPYAEYLKSKHWLNLRKKMIETAGGRCQLCNKDGTLNVHHRTYERRGNESLSDLIVLCRACHAKFHDKLP